LERRRHVLEAGDGKLERPQIVRLEDRHLGAVSYPNIELLEAL
jgi:hypothetical protein